MSDALPPPDDAPDDAPDMTAAELALGLLDGDERAAAMRHILADRDFAAEVERWRGYLAPLFDLWPEAQAPDAAWSRIERSLDGTPITSSSPARGWLWPGIAACTSIAAAALLVMVVDRPLPAPVPAPRPAATAATSGPMLVAAIAPIAKGAPVTALYDPRSGSMRLTAASAADTKLSQELWVIAGDGAHSLGLLHDGGTSMTVDAGNRARMAAGAVLAVSLEPLGGSPTGQPTGPVVAKGALSQV